MCKILVIKKKYYEKYILVRYEESKSYSKNEVFIFYKRIEFNI